VIPLRSALRFAYDGTAFDGYPAVEGGRTVEGALVEGLEQQFDTIDLHSGSRTDRGVSALGNVCAVRTDGPMDTGRLNASLDGVAVTGISAVDEGFNPRFARWRWYRYIITDPAVDPDRGAECAAVFRGEHDFANFSRKDERGTVRKIIDVRVRSDPSGVLVLDVKGVTFIWNMVRRMTGAVIGVGRGEASVEEVKVALDRPDVVRSFGTAPPEPLILMAIEYPDLGFETVPIGVKAENRVLDHLTRYSGPTAVARALAHGEVPEW